MLDGRLVGRAGVLSCGLPVSQKQLGPRDVEEDERQRMLVTRLDRLVVERCEPVPRGVEVARPLEEQPVDPVRAPGESADHLPSMPSASACSMAGGATPFPAIVSRKATCESRSREE